MHVKKFEYSIKRDPASTSDSQFLVSSLETTTVTVSGESLWIQTFNIYSDVLNAFRMIFGRQSFLKCLGIWWLLQGLVRVGQHRRWNVMGLLVSEHE